MIEANKDRLVSMLEDIAAFTEPLENGVQRISYSKEYKAAQLYLAGKMKELGMNVFADQTGNLFAVMNGKEGVCKIMSGSHLDTVRVAGKYDGTAGIVAAMEVAALLKENNIALKHPYQIICTIGEEGTRFNQTLMGSQFLCGVHSEKQYDDFRGFDGSTLKETIETYGLEDVALIRDYHAEDVACMLELHGEQGPVLEKAEKKIGIVRCIAGIAWLEITVAGFSNHAGTTPMYLRKDAGIEAYNLILQLNEYVSTRYSDEATITVGQLSLEPGSSNCIPGSCRFMVDVRSGSKDIIRDILDKINEQKMQSESKGFVVSVKPMNEKDPVEMDRNIEDAIKNSCEAYNYPFVEMNSGAGHDSMIFAKRFPTGMIFVPNRDGISHNPAEFIEAEDLKIGTDVLFDVICKLDEVYDEKNR